MRATIRIDNRIRLDLQGIDPRLIAALVKDFTHVNPQREYLRRIGKPHWNEPKTIETWARDEKELSFPRGGMPRLRKRLEEWGLARTVEDAREAGDPDGETMPAHLLTLYGYQEKAVQTMLARECGIIRAPTGAGKTCIAFGFAARARVCTLVIVYNSGLFKQWLKRAQKELGLAEKDIGIIRGKKRTLRPLTIAMQQNINAHGVDAETAGYFGAVLVDETHRAAAATMFRAVDPFPARYRIGISADHRRKDKKEFLTHDLFGEVLEDIKRTALIKSGHVLDVQIRIIPTDFEAGWYGLPSETDPERDLDTTRLIEEISIDFTRNQLVLTTAIEETLAGEQVLVLSHRREHCLVLDQGLVQNRVKTGFLIGGDDYEQEFDRTVAGLEQGSVRAAAGTFQAIGQGLDLPSVAVGICATPIASNRQVFNQVRGRFCRISTDKSTARLYYLWDRKVFGLKHLKNIVQWNANVVIRVNDSWESAREWLKSVE